MARVATREVRRKLAQGHRLEPAHQQRLGVGESTVQGRIDRLFDQAIRVLAAVTHREPVSYTHLERKHGKLDILVNNAGIMADDADKGVSGQSIATWRKTFDTNLFGVIDTTQAFLPLLRKSDAGRIVNVSSLLGSISEHQNPASFIYEFKGVPSYNVSKSCLLYTSRCV